jgi:hypothetical protein
MNELYLRKVEHLQARDNYRVILKSESDETEIGSIGIQHFTSTDAAWVWGIDTVIPMRQHQTEGRGADRRDCMRLFKAAWEALAADRSWLLEFMEAKRQSRRGHFTRE